ncbi:MAG: glycosyltransferase family 2 protein [Nitrospirae bacterium]|nr:glycosyltransferase family 2 protein [Nitrospirota bacterium]MBI3353061.1 glycosyltransferase family 2 protein [Nitrospirota bacterium]
MILSLIIFWFNVFILGYFILLDGFYSFLMGISIFSTLRHLGRLRLGRDDEMFKDSTVPPVSVLVPAFNEENVIVQNIHGLLSLNYPHYEIIIINDGSTDHTLSKIIKAFHLKPIDLIYRPIIPTNSVKSFYINPKFPKLILVDKTKGGKADSLNVGINLARSPYFCSIDADTLLEKSALLRLVRPILEHPTTTIASGGIVRIVNGCEVKHGAVTKVLLSKNILPRLQVIEYLRSFLFGRTGMSFLSSLMIISGTFSLFHKKSVQDVGGYNRDTVSEDMEIVVHLHRDFKKRKMPYRIVFVSDPVCWTEAPSTLSMLAKQRRRWHKGLAESLSLHFKMMFNPKYGAIGLIGMGVRQIYG